ncbi:sulfatase [Mariniblastus fucicola]|uniref:Choline-sulfatase n=1 Tax=Mariniblastus fucicola TaxID=980251 RepID=A0A5B9PJX4_9BACT|nr:sulfatase [Mariniblastus fucicola]QEG24976.1 Choline-sulfatase [Mariniblastus fucicola]
MKAAGIVQHLFTAVWAMIVLVSSPTDNCFAQEKPNILFIAIDDQNDWIGCMDGHPQIKTPHIDGLATQGTLFLNAHCQSPLCNASRTSLMTGLRPSTTGVYGLAPTIRQVQEFSDVVTLPQYLKNNGYTTYMAGKIYHGGYGRQKTHNEFDFVGPPAEVGAKPEKKLVETPSPHPLVDWGTFPHRDEDKGDWEVASWGVETLDAKPKEPFFLSVGFFLPHVPCYVTQKWYDMYPEETLELPPFLAGDRNDTPRFSWYLHWKLPEPRQDFLVESSQWKNLVRSYLASTTFIDAQIGRVLDALERNDYDDNTIIVLWSDHGFHLGEKRITGKNTLWDRSTRVPLIFAGPGMLQGQTCTQPAELLDMYPTLLELCGLPKNEALEGLSLMPQLKDPNTVRERPAITTHNHDNHGIRSENWRYIQYADGSEELYDMQADPNEWTNLIGDSKHDAVIEQHRRWLPNVNQKPAPGSKHRILTFENGDAIWEGTPIEEDDSIPEIANGK